MHRIKNKLGKKRFCNEESKNHSKKLVPPDEFWEFENAGAFFSTPQRVFTSSKHGTPGSQKNKPKDYYEHEQITPKSSKSMSTSRHSTVSRRYLGVPQGGSAFDEEEFDLVSNISGVPGELRKRPLRYGILNPSISQILVDFCARTSAHGIPHIGASASVFGKLFWTVVFIFCFMAFSIQTYWTITRYARFDKIIEMELKFEPAPFPSVTVCNINPYKYSQAKNYKEMKMIFDAHEYKVSHSKNAEEHSRRRKRASSYNIEPLYAVCRCRRKDMECIPVRDPQETRTQQCFCYFDSNSRSLWPCYHVDMWTKSNCSDCTISGTCLYPRELFRSTSNDQLDQNHLRERSSTSRPPKSKGNPNHDSKTPCLCQNISYSCLIDPLEPIDIWDPTAYQTYEPPTVLISEEDLSNMGLDENVTDEGTVTTKANENLVFAAGSLHPEIRTNISYAMNELILQCTFNGKQWISNLNWILFLVCATPSITILQLPKATVERDLHMNELQRLGEPFGKCRKEKREEERYIYSEKYSTEGCYRSCFQNFIISNCKCGDPRFPIPDNIESCSNRSAKECIVNVTTNVVDFDYYGEECDCIQPCREFTFQVTFSAGIWPASNFKTGQCAFLDTNNSTSCFDYYAKHTAYVEIYYEQLNYELRKETQAYGIESLLADFGGNIGLWIGFSAITMVEWLLLMIEVITYVLHEAPYRKVHERANKFRKKKPLKSTAASDWAFTKNPYAEDFPVKESEEELELDLTMEPL